MLIMHSYTFRDYPVERALRKAKKFGYDAVELSACHWGWRQAEMVKHLDETVRLGEAIGMPIGVVDFGGDFLHADPTVRRQAVDNLADLIRRAAGHGIKTVNGGCGTVVPADPDAWNANGSAAAGPEHWERAAGCFRQVAEVAEQTGVMVTFEIHMNALHDTAAATVRLLESIGSSHVKAALDAGNMLPLQRAETGPEAVKLLGAHLGYVHMKNCKLLPGGGADYAVPLGGGHIDFYAVLRALRETGFQGDYCIEYCGKGDATPRAEGDLAYLMGLLREVEDDSCAS